MDGNVFEVGRSAPETVGNERRQHQQIAGSDASNVVGARDLPLALQHQGDLVIKNDARRHDDRTPQSMRQVNRGTNLLERKAYQPSFGGAVERPAQDLNRARRRISRQPTTCPRHVVSCGEAPDSFTGRPIAHHVRPPASIQVRRGVVSAAESTRVSPKVVRVSP